MVNKAYIILHDGDNLLVGKGGKSGKKKEMRPGLHLPGGTINTGENLQTAVIRELEEETGISPKWYGTKGSFRMLLNGFQVDFFVAYVDSVPNLISSRRNPAIRNAFDEPFAEVLSLSLTNCWDDLGFQLPATNWFRQGLLKAHQQNLLTGP